MKPNRQISRFPRHDIVIKRRDCVFPEMSDPGLRSEMVHSGRRPGQNITVRHAFAYDTVEILFLRFSFQFFLLFASTNENVRSFHCHTTYTRRGFFSFSSFLFNVTRDCVSP